MSDITPRKKQLTHADARTLAHLCAVSCVQANRDTPDAPRYLAVYRVADAKLRAYLRALPEGERAGRKAALVDVEIEAMMGMRAEMESHD